MQRLTLIGLCATRSCDLFPRDPHDQIMIMVVVATSSCLPSVAIQMPGSYSGVLHREHSRCQPDCNYYRVISIDRSLLLPWRAQWALLDRAIYLPSGSVWQQTRIADQCPADTVLRYLYSSSCSIVRVLVGTGGKSVVILRQSDLISDL